MKIKGWCALHYHLVDAAKFRLQCRKAKAGKLCRWFEYKVPEWKQKTKRKFEGQAGIDN